MNEAIRRMLERYDIKTLGDYVPALREILQSVALLGLWRSRFFERAAFYGGTALRLLYGLDRYSEDLDFSLLDSDHEFTLEPYCAALIREMESFGFEVTVETRRRPSQTGIESAFLKANTRHHLLVIGAGESIASYVHRKQLLKIRLEVDTAPPDGFTTEMQYVLQPVPFAVRTYVLPDLFAGKIHAVLCRSWQSRVKGRDWYDMVWYVANHPALHLAHLESRMRQSGHYTAPEPLRAEAFRTILHNRIGELDIDQIRSEVSPFLQDPTTVSVWSQDFFHALVERISCE